jgi:hypothetical protein
MRAGVPEPRPHVPRGGQRVAGYYGLDRYLLPMLRTPWRPALGRDLSGADRRLSDLRRGQREERKENTCSEWSGGGRLLVP